MMRVTNQMIARTVTGNITATMARLMTLQNQASTGKRITQASDDPSGTSQALSIRDTLASVVQFARNVDQAKAVLSTVDTSLDNINKALQQSKTIALSGANAATTDDQRKNLALQVQQQIDFIVKEINSTQLDRHIYGGFQTDKDPVTANPSGTPPYVYNGDDGVTKVQVSDDLEMDITVTAKQVLNFGGASDASRPDTLTTLTHLRDALNSGDQAAISTSMKEIDASTQTVVGIRGKMGTRAAQMDVYANRLAQDKTTLSQWQSQVEDVDIADTLTQLQMEQNVYQTSLIAASKIIQPSLADFLK